jgi:biopolymer transport protein ExbB
MNTFLAYLHQGGVMMYPLILCSIVAVGIILERSYTFRKATRVDPEELLEEIKKAYRTDDQGAAALKALDGVASPFARVFARGLKNAGRPAEAIDMAISQEASNEIPVLENYLVGLKTIITVAPLLGLLGTIGGMMASFKQVAASGLSSPTAVMNGVSEALVATATGIAVAAVALIFYNYFANLVKRFVEDMEYYGTELTNIITGRIS